MRRRPIRKVRHKGVQEMKAKFRVWHIPQIPGKPFYVPVDSVEEGLRIQDILARYDEFQFRNNIKPDYVIAGGVEEFADGEWEEVDPDDYL